MFHATTCAAERNWSLLGNLFTKALLLSAQKLVYVRGNALAMHRDDAAMHSEEAFLKLLGDAADYEYGVLSYDLWVMIGRNLRAFVAVNGVD
jgi:hypothetical protein